ncbi:MULTISPECIES: hypothetical protein [Streptomyces]|uniref:hypothetical protein n=1 Tax=Streptomyces TaxID=1883 RepID=UPI002270BC52|nr:MULTISPECIES: hypothetical protein [unclassified Streptomyces]MCY0940937.1 hypothetical protein [Streptomyces sp. H34-AA3]MCZ4087920.1 hypothetical protein [Streptomyces sp. H34-S5]
MTVLLKRMSLATAAFFLMTGAMLTIAPAAHAAGYPTMTVQAGSAARSAPYAESWSFIGWVTSDGWRNPNGQASWVSCYKDAGWATGNYSSNRWFRAYVNYSGGSAPVWAYVHSSFVTNQSSVPAC